MTPSFKLAAPESETTYWIYTHESGEHSSKPRPAVLFMDGDDQFVAAIAAYDELRRANTVEPLLLVGVGYGASYSRPSNRRGRDYTPVAHGDEPSSGGGSAFLEFLTTTLWTELGARHPVDRVRRGIAGHSLGSLLVLHALFQPKPWFTHYLASAPSIWWAERAILDQARRLRVRQARLSADLYLSVGANDTESMTGDLALLERQLTQAPFAGLNVTTERLAGRDHYNVLPDAFSRGLNTLFGRAA